MSQLRQQVKTICILWPNISTLDPIRQGLFRIWTLQVSHSAGICLSSIGTERPNCLSARSGRSDLPGIMSLERNRVCASDLDLIFARQKNAGAV